jgi:alanine racemase
MDPQAQSPSTAARGATLRAEISTCAVRRNLRLLRERLKEGTRLCAVVKADAYGHGLALLLEAICREVDALAVATAGEAMWLRQAGYDGELLMFFSPTPIADEQTLCELIEAGVTLTVTTSSELARVGRAGRRIGRAGEIHLKVDTGMRRSGMDWRQAARLAGESRRSPGVRLTGLYTHFAAADESDKSSALTQLERFLQTVERAGGREGLTLHAANSAAAIDLPESHLDMVRAGIAVYGYQPSDEIRNRLPLEPALRVTGRLMQVKDVEVDDRCGYGLTYTFRRATRIGLVPMGYADGYPRNLGNRAVMRIGQVDCPVRGRVSMDQIIIDLGDAPEANVGDEVEIVSDRPLAPNSIENLARLAGTIPYELTVRLGGRVQRVAVD